MNAFLAELRRRNVFRVAAVYLVTAWLIMQVVAVSAPVLRVPEWFPPAIFLLLAVGFPVALVLAWAFEMTPQGVKRTTAEAGAPPSRLGAADVVLIAAVVALAGASLFQALRPRTATDAADGAATTSAADAPAAASAEPLSIAVLPFADMSPNHDQDYFSDGLSEELLNVLAQIPELRVAGRTSSFAFKGRDDDLRVIGDRLGVANVLEGSVRKDGDRLRITAQLVSATDGYHLWSETYDRRLDDVFAVQEEIATAVADALSVTLGVSTVPVAPGRTANVEEYDLYLRARALFNAGAPAELERAAALYREVLARDPDYGPARSGLVLAYGSSLDYIPERRAEIARNLEAVAAEAHARAPGDWTTYFADATLHWSRHEWSEAERALTRAQELAPASNVDVAQVRAGLALHMGDNQGAIDRVRAVLRIDPLSMRGAIVLQTALDHAGRFDEAEAEYQRSLDLPGGPEEIEHNALIRVWNDGDADLIRARFDRFLSRQTVPMPLLAAVRDVVDDPEAALVLLRAGYDDPANQDPTRQFLIGLYAAHFGDTELALAAMRRSLVDMNGASPHALWYADMAETRRTPGFKDLVRDVGLVDYWRETGNWGDYCRPLDSDGGGDDDFACE